MKRNEKTIIAINAILIALAIATTFSQLFSNVIRTVSQTILLVVFAIIATKLFKPKKANKGIANTATKTVIIILIASLIIAFNLGMIIGFTRTFFPPSWRTFLLGFLPSFILIIASEFYRKAVIGNSYDNKTLIALGTVALIIVGISTEISFVAINSIETSFIAFSSIVLPAIAENLLSTYLMRRAGMKPVIAYRLPRALYLYILPIAPAFSQYLYSVMWVAIPFFIYILARKDMSNIFSKREEKEKRSQSKKRNISIITIPAATALVTLVVLTSGVLRYKMIAIASGSMSPAFNRGDAVIYDKETEPEVGEVLAFEHEGRIITHRVISIAEDGTEKVYYTKGDANDTSDNYEITKESRLGKVECVVKYIGIPTVWFNEVIGNIR